MGKRSATGPDEATVKLDSQFAGTGRSATTELAGRFALSLWGGIATVRLVRSFDAGATWLPCADGTGTVTSWTASAGGMSCDGEVGGESGVLYALDCTAWTSATRYRVSQ